MLALRKGKVSLGDRMTAKDEKRERWVVAMRQKGELYSLSVRVGCWKG